MVNFQTNSVSTFTIGDAWREVMWLCVKNGYDFVVKVGSYKGQIRRQLPFVTIRIIEPWRRPLSPIMPANLPSPTDECKISSYFSHYLMGMERQKNEEYTYGAYIVPQVARVVELLNRSLGNTNQACIAVGDQNSVYLPDPPCLRTVSFKVVNSRLNMTVFFRSWDLFSGLPQNLGGLQMLKEMILASLSPDMIIDDGELIAYSDGLHLYDQYFDLVNMLNVEKIKVEKKILEDKERFAQNLTT